MARIAVLMALVALTVSACHVPSASTRRPSPPVAAAPPPVYQPPPPVYQPAPPPRGRPVAWQGGGPPPWAPAHGYRGKGKGKNKQRGRYNAYAAPYGIASETCYREDVGRFLGGVTGAAAGYQVGDGAGQAAAVVGGTIIGMMVGGHIGRSMDELDQNCVGQVLEHAPPDEPIVWESSHSGGRYQITPSEPFSDRQGRYCREYQTVGNVGGRAEQVYGTACRQPDGSWQLVN